MAGTEPVLNAEVGMRKAEWGMGNSEVGIEKNAKVGRRKAKWSRRNVENLNHER
jgi:hypothetical protein